MSNPKPSQKGPRYLVDNLSSSKWKKARPPIKVRHKDGREGIIEDEMVVILGTEVRTTEPISHEWQFVFGEDK